jgi:hypothetical protein
MGHRFAAMSSVCWGEPYVDPDGISFPRRNDPVLWSEFVELEKRLL